MRTILPALALAPMLLAACMPETVEPDPAQDTLDIAAPAADQDECGSASYLPLIGQPGPVISVPANTAYRSYRTGDPVTMDFNPARLNFEHDKTGRLVRVSCG